MIMTLTKQTIIRFIKDMSCYDLLKDIGPVKIYGRHRSHYYLWKGIGPVIICGRAKVPL